MSKTERQIVRLINKARAAHGLPKVRIHRGLVRAAHAHSKSMARVSRVSHGDYAHRVRRYVKARRVGENLAWMRGCSPRWIVKQWQGSAPHRSVLFSGEFRRVGVGVVHRGKLCMVTADFATAR